MTVVTRCVKVTLGYRHADRQERIYKMARTRVSKKDAVNMLASVDGGMWGLKDLALMGPINLKNGFRLFARRCGVAINYYCVAIVIG